MKNDNYNPNLMAKVANYYTKNQFNYRCHSSGVITYNMVDDPEDEDEQPVQYTINVHNCDLDVIVEFFSDFPADDTTASELDKYCRLIHQRIRNGKFVFYYQTDVMPNTITFEVYLNCSADSFTDELMDKTLAYSSTTVHIFGRFFKDIIDGLISAEDAFIIAFSVIDDNKEDNNETGCDDASIVDFTEGDSSDELRPDSHDDGGDYWFYCSEA